MAGGIKGITVKIGGDTTELGKSLSRATKQSTALQKELKGVNTLLKFDPKNVTLLKQKADLLKKSISETKQKVHDLVEVQKKVDSGEIEMTEEEYRNLQREIASTEQKLKQLTDEQIKFGSVGAQQIAQVGEKLKDVGGKIEGVGNKLLPLTGIIGGIGTVAVKTSADFDNSMSNVSAISGATGNDLQSLTDKAREMGAQTKFSASESADAMSYMAMAGWKTNEMLDGIAGVMDLASASGEDLAKTSDILTDGLTAFGLSAKDSSRMADVMASASSNANTNVSMLGESYKYCASTAGAMGYSLEDITESLGLMANAGVKGSQAGTSLKTAMINLAKPTKQMQTAMDKYGISITNTDGSMKSWNEVVDNLRGSLGGLSEAEKTSAVATIFGKEATAGMLSVINAGPKDVEKLNKAINNSTGCAKKMADTMNDNLVGQLTILKSQLEELAISFGEMLMPMIRGVVSAIQGFVDKLNSMSEGQRKIILVILAVVASIGPLLIAIGKVLTAVGTVMTWAPKISGALNAIKLAIAGVASPIYVVIAVIGVLVGAFVTLWNTNEEFRKKITQIWNSIKDTIDNFVEQIKSRLSGISETVNNICIFIKAVWLTLCEFLAPIFEGTFQGIADFLSGMCDFIIGVIDVFIGLFTGDWDTFLSGINKAWSSIWNAIVGFLGGVIQGLWNLVKKGFNNIKTSITTIWNGIKSVTTTIWNGIKTAVMTPINTVKNTVTSAVNGIKSTVTSVWNGIKSTTTSVWNGIKSAIMSPIETAKAKVKNVIDAIKGFFNFKITWPKIPMPHFGIKPSGWKIGDLLKGSIPKLSIEWYKNGGIFDRPTIIPTISGLKGVGEAGPEAVAPIDVLQKYVREAVNVNNQALELKLDKVINLMSNYYPDALKAMDRPVVVGVTSLDNALSDKNNKVVRGW